MGLLGAIEAGGTKFVLGVADSDNPNKIIDKVSFPTTTGEETVEKTIKYFDQYRNIDAIGIAAFGPIDVREDSKLYGHVLNTPKPGWSGFDFLGTMQSWRGIKYSWTTDVNAAGWSEFVTGAAREANNMTYLTIGTGIGAGIVTNGKLLAGFSHPEAGHILVAKHPDDHYLGKCPYHGDGCLEGLASGPAIEERWGISAKSLPDDHEAWKLEAYYIAQALVNYTLILRPDIIVLGGGVPHREVLLPLIRNHFEKLLADYVDIPSVDQYIVTVQNNDNAGILGSFLLAKSLTDNEGENF